MLHGNSVPLCLTAPFLPSFVSVSHSLLALLLFPFRVSLHDPLGPFLSFFTISSCAVELKTEMSTASWKPLNPQAACQAENMDNKATREPRDSRVPLHAEWAFVLI